MKKTRSSPEALDPNSPAEDDATERAKHERVELQKKLEILQNIITLKRMHEVSDDDLVN